MANLKQSVAFYVEKLGFKIRFIGPEGDPFFAIVGRDEISIFLKGDASEIQPAPNYTKIGWARWDAYIFTDNPDELYNEFHKAGVQFRQPLKNDDDGLRGFEITDADGYVLFFGCPASGKS